MAIIVDKVSTIFNMKSQWAKEAGFDESSEFQQRIARANSWGLDMSDTLPTKPRRQDKLRKPTEYYLYNLQGLLGTIFSLIELDDDYSKGLRNLEDIASITNNISIPWVPSDTCIPHERSQRVLYVSPTNTIDISSQLFEMDIPRKRRALNGQNGIVSLDGHMEIFIKDDKFGERNFMSLNYLAYNLHPYGDDVDNLTFRAV